MRAISMVMLSAVFVLSGCAAPTVDTSDESKMTFDGLYPVKGSRADEAWARPDVDLAQYSKIMLQSVGVEYRPGGESGRTFYSRSRGGPYEVTEEQKARFEATMREAFLEELAKSENYTFTSEPGPDVLLIRGGLLDVVSYVPPDAIGGRVDVYLSQVGEATLVLELRDSITEAILARAVDRRAAEDFAGLQESNRVNNRAEVRRLAQTWARMLRERLDEFGAPAE
ncbi:MAG TPA: DUF3313 family protein [Woeseiaceae bacterium]|nr:DUF3313 family protein [Woeseiaceae bacterium]